MTEAREIISKIYTQSDCLEKYAEADGYESKPLPSVFHLQAAHFRAYANELEAALATLTAERDALIEDRDLWKQSEATCNTQYNKLLAERDALREELAAIRALPDGESEQYVDDDKVWKAVDAAQDEAKAWRIIKWPNGNIEVIDDLRMVMWPTGVAREYKRIPFKDEAQAKAYIEWCSIKAALQTLPAPPKV